MPITSSQHGGKMRQVLAEDQRHLSSDWTLCAFYVLMSKSLISPSACKTSNWQGTRCRLYKMLVGGISG